MANKLNSKGNGKINGNSKKENGKTPFRKTDSLLNNDSEIKPEIQSKAHTLAEEIRSILLNGPKAKVELGVTEKAHLIRLRKEIKKLGFDFRLIFTTIMEDGELEVSDIFIAISYQPPNVQKDIN